MRHRLLVAAGTAAVLVALAATAGCGGDSNDTGSGSTAALNVDGDANATGTLTVWLQEDAQTGWPTVVADATKAFNAKYPKVKVDVQYQKWTDHLTKLDAQLAGNRPPDVVEMGDTETASYLVNGAFRELTPSQGVFENSDSWNTGLQSSCTLDGKLYCVPYYTGSRVVVYRKDMFAQAGISGTPKSYDELMAAGDKLNAKFGGDKNFSAFYLPGKFWYAAMTFVNDARGHIATRSGGRWQGGLDSPEAIEGLTRWNNLVQKLYRGDKTTDEATPQQYTVFARGHVAMMYGLGWEAGSVAAPPDAGGNPALKDKVGVFPLPSSKPGEAMQSFAGGSDLAIPARSKHADWAAAWIKEFTGTKAQQGLLAAKNVPNSTALLDRALSDPAVAPFAASAKSSWFVPVAANWAKVEKSFVLQNGLVDIVTGKVSVADGAKRMNQQVEQTLNGD